MGDETPSQPPEQQPAPEPTEQPASDKPATEKTQVEFEDRQGNVCYGTLEKFLPTDPEPFLTIQREDGSPPTRVKQDSPEADRLRKLYPELAGLTERDIA